MTAFRGTALRAAAVLALAAGIGCGSSKTVSTPTGGGGTTGGGGGQASASQLNFAIQSADVPTTGNPTVTFKVTDASGAAIDLLKEIQAGATTTPRMSNTPHFVLAQLEDTNTYTNLYEQTVQGKAYGTANTAPALQSAIQPAYDPPAGGTFPIAQLKDQGGGVYTYTFTKPPTTAAAKLDRTKTHTIGIYGARTVMDTSTSKPKDFPASATFNFIPGGAGTPRTYAAVSDAACNQCHQVLQAHDERRATQLCITCHAGDKTDDYADPDSGNSIDFQVMIHKIHRGANLPSVRAGGSYFIVGFRGTAANPVAEPAVDFSDVVFPQSIMNCTMCHQGAQATNADDWKNKPNLKACTSCHDQVRFADTTVAATCAQGVDETQPCNHPLSIQATTDCTSCHAATSAIMPVDKAHADPLVAAEKTFQYQIVGVTVGADRKPVVQYQVLQNGAAMSLTSDPWSHGADSRLGIDIGWPPQEYNNTGSGYVNAANAGKPGPGQPVQLNALPGATGSTATAVAGQSNVYQVTSTAALPADVTNFTVVMEGHPAIADPFNTGKFLRVPVTNDVKFFNAQGQAVATSPRRTVVDVKNCQICHQQLAAHGNNRNGRTDQCVVCHNPNATDAEWITTAAASMAAPEQPIDFKVLVHEIHGDKIKTHPVDIHAFGGTLVELPLGFPGLVGDCAICHAGTSYQLPLQSVVQDTTLTTTGNPPTSATKLNKTIAVCTSCHDFVKFDGSAATICRANGAAITADCNHEGGPQSNDAGCAACHGPNAQFDLAKFHPIQAPTTP